MSELAQHSDGLTVEKYLGVICKEMFHCIYICEKQNISIWVLNVKINVQTAKKARNKRKHMHRFDLYVVIFSFAMLNVNFFPFLGLFSAVFYIYGLSESRAHPTHCPPPSVKRIIFPLAARRSNYWAIWQQASMRFQSLCWFFSCSSAHTFMFKVHLSVNDKFQSTCSSTPTV